MSIVAIPLGREACPGHFQWSAFGATYPDTVCSSALEWDEGYIAWGLCDADDNFREKGVPCPFCNPEDFLEYQWGAPEERSIIWESDGTPVAGSDIHFHDGQALWWTATRGNAEERVLIKRLIELDDEEEIASDD